MNKKDRWLTREYFLFLALFLILTPFLVVLNDVLTKLVERFSLYVFLQDFVVPFEVKFVRLIVLVFGVESKALPSGLMLQKQWLQFNWNCLGWQSLLLFFASLFIGFRGGSFTNQSKVKVIIFGVFGIFWVNIFRISFIVILAAYARPVFRILFHDVFSAFVSILYLIFFWWFVYSFVLEERQM